MRALALVVALGLTGCSATSDRIGSASAPAVSEPTGCCCLEIAGPPEDCRSGFTVDDCNRQGEFQGQKVRWSAGRCPGQ
jgi:hypothetical protein